jgi:hypothetical protein
MNLVASHEKNVYDISQITTPSLNGEGTDAQNQMTDSQDGDSTP